MNNQERKQQNYNVSPQARHRDSSLDAVGGLFILYMIIEHVFQWSGTEDDMFYVNSHYVFFMFMPWFFYKSGMFHKKGDFLVTVKHDAGKLLVPYVAYTIIGEVFLSLYMFQQYGFSWRQNPIKEILLKGSCNGNLPLWFLLSLFIVKIVVSWSDKHRLKHTILFIFSAIVAGGGDFAP